MPVPEDAIGCTSERESGSTARPAGGRDTLYYDGLCPLCAREIASLKTARHGELDLVDIHSLDAGPPPDAGAHAGVRAEASAAAARRPSKDELLRTLHLKRADGTWLRGADANVAAWEGTASARLWRMLRWPLIRRIVDRFYAWWAGWRYRRLYGEQFDEGRHAS